MSPMALDEFLLWSASDDTLVDTMAWEVVPHPCWYIYDDVDAFGDDDYKDIKMMMMISGKTIPLLCSGVSMCTQFSPW